MKCRHLFYIEPLLIQGVLLGGLDEVGLGVQFNEIAHVGIIHPITGNQTELSCEDADFPLAGDPEEMLRVIVIRVDPFIQQNSIAPDTGICAETATNLIYPDARITGGVGIYLYTFEETTDSLNWTEARAASSQETYDPAELAETTWFRRIVESGTCWDTTTAIKFYVDTVIINNEMYDEGDGFEGYVIKEIEAQGIIVEKEGEEYFLKWEG